MSTYNIELRTGDVLLYQRAGAIGWLITKVTGGDRSHAGIVLVGWERNWVCDAAATGIDLRPVSNDLDTGSRIAVYRVPDTVPWEGIALRRLTAFAISKVGVYRYGLRKMLRNAWTEVFGVPPGAKDPDDMPTKAMCSEWVSLLLRAFADFDPCPKWPDRFTTPDDLARKSDLVCVCESLTRVNK